MTFFDLWYQGLVHLTRYNPVQKGHVLIYGS